MQREEINPDLSGEAFEFFFWFSRFEYALKVNGYLKSQKLAAPAEPGWAEFTKRWCYDYEPSQEAVELLRLNPQRQIVGQNGTLIWTPIVFSNDQSSLAQVTLTLKTIRNNLFHGGKCGNDGWDDTKRTHELLVAGRIILDQLAHTANIEHDFYRRY